MPKVDEKHRQDVRERILETAGALFARKGYHVTSMDDIVRESGLSKGAIYGYFESKEDLFLTLSDNQLASIIGNMRAAFSPGDTATTKLMKAAEIHFRQIRDPNDVWCATLERWIESPRIPSLEKRIRKRYDLAHDFLAGIIEEGRKNGEFRKGVDPAALSSVLLATMRGLAIHARAGQDFDWLKIKATILSVIFGGILSDRGTAPKLKPR